MDRCPAPKAGMHILIGDGFAPDADLGRDYVRAVAALRAVMGLTGGAAENLALAEIVAQALQPIYGAAVMRTAITALLAPPKDVLLQLRMLTGRSKSRINFIASRMPSRVPPMMTELRTGSLSTFTWN